MARKKKQPEAGQVYLNESQRLQQRNKCQIGVRLTPAVIERLRNLVWATGRAGGINGIVEEATEKMLEQLERAYEKEQGKPVPTRPTPG